MNSLQKFLLGILTIPTFVVIGVLVMIYGWGVEPRSWGWIIGGGVGLNAIVVIFKAIAED